MGLAKYFFHKELDKDKRNSKQFTINRKNNSSSDFTTCQFETSNKPQLLQLILVHFSLGARQILFSV